MKKFLLAMIFFSLVAMATLTLATNTQAAPEPSNANASITAPANTNAPAKLDPSVHRLKPALKPLLLVPLAGVLYLIYERLTQRK